MDLKEEILPLALLRFLRVEIQNDPGQENQSPDCSGWRFNGCSTNIHWVPVMCIALAGAGGHRDGPMGADCDVTEWALGVGLKVWLGHWIVHLNGWILQHVNYALLKLLKTKVLGQIITSCAVLNKSAISFWSLSCFSAGILPHPQ